MKRLKVLKRMLVFNSEQLGQPKGAPHSTSSNQFSGILSTHAHATDNLKHLALGSRSPSSRTNESTEMMETPFRILDLPIELRMHILRFLLVAPYPIEITALVAPYTQIAQVHTNNTLHDDGDFAIFGQALRINKQFLQEGTEILYRENYFYFTNVVPFPPRIPTFASQIGARNFQEIRKMAIMFPIWNDGQGFKEACKFIREKANILTLDVVYMNPQHRVIPELEAEMKKLNRDISELDVRHVALGTQFHQRRVGARKTT